MSGAPEPASEVQSAELCHACDTGHLPVLEANVVLPELCDSTDYEHLHLELHRDLPNSPDEPAMAHLTFYNRQGDVEVFLDQQTMLTWLLRSACQGGVITGKNDGDVVAYDVDAEQIVHAVQLYDENAAVGIELYPTDAHA